MLSNADFLTILEQVTYRLEPASLPTGGSEAFIDRNPAGDGRHVVFDIDPGIGWHAELIVLEYTPVPQVEPDQLRLWVGDRLVLSATYIGLDDTRIAEYVPGLWEALFLDQRSGKTEDQEATG